MRPKISVVTINYNNKKGLERTLESVISQNFNDYEYIVIDGGSNDGSKTLIEQFADVITYWISEADKGIYHAMNKGISNAQGEYIIFINSGDKFLNENSLKIGSKYLTGIDIIYSNLEHIDDNNCWVHHYPAKLNVLYFLQNSLPHPATFIKRSAFDMVGRFDENLKIVSDWKWYLNAIIKYNLSYMHVDEIISTFYLDGISSDKESIKKIQLETNNTLKEMFHFSPEDINEMITLKQNAYKLALFEHKFNFLKKYKIIKLLDQLGIIKIPE